MLKPTVYVETTVIGYLTSRPQPDPVVRGHQLVTEKWRSTAYLEFELVVSEVVLAECAGGDPEAAKARLDAVAPFPLVPVTPEVEQSDL